ncbi:hypothetical protein ILYODFUR_032505 [Ilyodon furcidens]|uniref:Uncharacterized protein n=1 Tax=Ilyodon furcidens TaxID=33524 RepID=A0ABV0SR04_9TELE
MKSCWKQLHGDGGAGDHFLEGLVAGGQTRWRSRHLFRAAAHICVWSRCHFLLGFSPNPSIEFYDQEPGERRLPHSSTCSISLSPPGGVEYERQVKELMEMSIKGSHGFGKIS